MKKLYSIVLSLFGISAIFAADTPPPPPPPVGPGPGLPIDNNIVILFLLALVTGFIFIKYIKKRATN